MQLLAILATALLAGLCAVHGRTARGIGKAADIREAPWLVQFDYAQDDGQFRGSTGSCAGTIIDEAHILTAQHCFLDGQKLSHILVRAGATNRLYGGEKYTVKSIATHPKAGGGTLNGGFDLAVVTLNEPLKFSDDVQPIQIASEPVEDGTRVTGGGWGVIQEGEEKFAPGLQTFAMEKLDSAECRWRLAAFNEESKNSLMCMVPRGGVSCAGDSGSGLWLPAAGDKPAQLFGVLSSGTICDANDPKATTVYVDVLNENVREFLSQFVDMSGKAVTHPAPKDAPAGPKVAPAATLPQGGLEGLFSGLAAENADESGKGPKPDLGGLFLKYAASLDNESGAPEDPKPVLDFDEFLKYAGLDIETILA